MANFGDINVTGGNNVNQFGDNNNATQTNHNAAETPEWRPPLIELQDQVKEAEWSEEAPAPYKHGSDTETYGSPKDLVDDALAVAATDIEVAETTPEIVLDEESFKEAQSGWQSKFKALLPLGVRIGASVGSAVVDSYVSKSPVIAGLQALFKEVQLAAE